MTDDSKIVTHLVTIENHNHPVSLVSVRSDGRGFRFNILHVVSKSTNIEFHSVFNLYVVTYEMVALRGVTLSIPDMSMKHPNIMFPYYDACIQWTLSCFSPTLQPVASSLCR